MTALARNKTFRPDLEPTLRRTDTSFQLNNDKISGPLSFLNPTQARFESAPSDAFARDGRASVSPQERALAEAVKPWEVELNEKPPLQYKWTSRDNRKGRHTLVVRLQTPAEVRDIATPPPSSHTKQVLTGVRRMFTTFPIGDISYLVAVIFTFGSLVFILNGVFVFFPLANIHSVFPGEVVQGGGYTAFIGATMFLVGGALLMLEADAHSACHASSGESLTVTRVVPIQRTQTFRPQNDDSGAVGLDNQVIAKNTAFSSNSQEQRWIWIPNYDDLRTHYIHDIGFLACSSLMVGCIVFWIGGVTSLPAIYTHFNTPAKVIGAYWAPQLIGGICFIISGALFTIETQTHVWRPAPGVLGWWIGAWNLVGGFGFTLCPIFGLLAGADGKRHWATYQACCSTFWGSCAFFIGSVIQWYESLDKHPVQHEKDV